MGIIVGGTRWQTGKPTNSFEDYKKSTSGRPRFQSLNTSDRRLTNVKNDGCGNELRYGC
uniref:Uncharacterized protein n=1 Tax=Parascaris univalens TaxID=6257 RepID=A0A915A269_PARUN